MDNHNAELTKWSVSYLRDVTPFASFRAAISYADGLANNELVKQIDAQTRTINLVSRISSTQSGSMEFETPRRLSES
jgi:hypothetical protein